MIKWDTNRLMERFFVLPNGEILSFFFPKGKKWACAFDYGTGKQQFTGKYLLIMIENKEVLIDRYVSQLEELK